MPNDTLRHRDFASQLTADAYHHLIRTVRQALPPPPGDSPDDLARRDHAAIARIAALHPANAAEADLAGLFVIASAQCEDCLRRAQQPGISADWAMTCRAQANSMMRQAQSALRLLLRLQAARQKTEADSAATELRDVPNGASATGAAGAGGDGPAADAPAVLQPRAVGTHQARSGRSGGRRLH